jgi:hypothetical protein
MIGQRLKLSGMRWTRPGATGILTRGCQQASNQWDEIWPPPHNQIPATDLARCRTRSWSSTNLAHTPRPGSCRCVPVLRGGIVE